VVWNGLARAVALNTNFLRPTGRQFLWGFFMPKSLEWKQHSNGNWVTQVHSGLLVTVFRRKDGRWAFVCDNNFSEDDYWCSEAAKQVAEELFGS
jgi:hypothetical protein